MAEKYWMLTTGKDTVWDVQCFLNALFEHSTLQKLLVPLRITDNGSIETRIISDPEELQNADPFAPVMTINAATLVLDFVQQEPATRLGAVLRACEIRALLEVARQQSVDLSNVTIIGVDCMGTFTEEDFEWRGNVTRLSNEVLQFARQGGIATYRYRPACQMCQAELPEETDIALHVLGLPARKMILVGARDEQVAEAFHIAALSDGVATKEIIEQHQHVKYALKKRHEQAKERLLAALGKSYQFELDSLIDHLEHCEVCQQALAICPIYTNSQHLPGQSDTLSKQAVVEWLVSCAGCGMCEEASNAHLPLTQIFAQLQGELALA